MRSTERLQGAGLACGPAPGVRSHPGRPAGFRLGAAAFAGLLLAAGCATSPPSATEWDFFAPAVPGEDPWYPKVAEWQERARAAPLAPLPALAEEEPGPRPRRFQPVGIDPLPETLASFAATERRALAKRIFHWTVRTVIFYYQSDVPAAERPEDGSFVAEDPRHDHWPTYAELVEQNGNDCDGLDLIAYRMLREFGFPEDQLYRGVVRRNRDSANHMVTLWFEDPTDPWVFDSTGAITLQFRRFSEISDWTPTAIFNENEQYTVRPRTPSLGAARRVRATDD